MFSIHTMPSVSNANAVDAESDAETGPSKRLRSGRPEKPFEECCSRTKRKKLRSLCKNYPVEAILSAADRVRENPAICPVFSPEKALVLMLDAALIKH